MNSSPGASSAGRIEFHAPTFRHLSKPCSEENYTLQFSFKYLPEDDHQIWNFDCSKSFETENFVAKWPKQMTFGTHWPTTKGRKPLVAALKSNEIQRCSLLFPGATVDKWTANSSIFSAWGSLYWKCFSAFSVLGRCFCNRHTDVATTSTAIMSHLVWYWSDECIEYRESENCLSRSWKSYAKHRQLSRLWLSETNLTTDDEIQIRQQNDLKIMIILWSVKSLPNRTEPSVSK